jgi:phosphorylcholine metabolism protein LicD
MRNCTYMDTAPKPQDMSQDFLILHTQTSFLGAVIKTQKSHPTYANNLQQLCNRFHHTAASTNKHTSCTTKINLWLNL